MKSIQATIIWGFTIPLAAGIVYSSSTGLFTPNYYEQEALNWEIQCRGQDMVDLFLVSPLLLLSGLFAARGNKIAIPVWAGINLYIAYTFLIFCFSVHFNSMFLIYCLNLGLSIYSLLFFLYNHRARENDVVKSQLLFKITSVYFIVIAILFYTLWLSGLIPAIVTGSVPKEIQDIGMPTNPVHVIDLSMFLPAVFIIGILLWKNSLWGIRLAPAFLAFFVLMNITIALLNYMMGQFLPATDASITWIMSGLAILSLALGYQYLSVFRKVSQP